MTVCTDRSGFIDDSGHSTRNGAMDALQDPGVEAANLSIRPVRCCCHCAKERQGFLADSAAYFDAERQENVGLGVARKEPFVGFLLGAFVIGMPRCDRTCLADVGKGGVVGAYVYYSAVATVGVKEGDNTGADAAAVDVAAGFVEGGKVEHKRNAVEEAGDGVVKKPGSEATMHGTAADGVVSVSIEGFAGGHGFGGGGGGTGTERALLLFTQI